MRYPRLKIVFALLFLVLASQAGTAHAALGDALDNGSLTWTSGGDATWMEQASVFYSDGDAAQSGVIDANQSSWIETTYDGPFSVSFFQKVSSQSGYDFLRFSVDGVEKGKISGEVNWQQKTYIVSTTGIHTLKWTYTKNGSINKGLDAGWVDRVVVSPVTKVEVLSPNGGEKLAAGSTTTITWKAPAHAEKFKLYYTKDNGTTWTAITTDYVTGTDYSWTVPVTTGNKAGCKIKVVGYTLSNVVAGTDISNAAFTIEVLKLTSPNGGENVISGASNDIGYTINGLSSVSSASFYYTMDSGTSWKLIGSTTANISPGSYTYPWTVPAVTAKKSYCKVKVVLKNSSGAIIATDLSDSVFAINPYIPPAPTEVSAASGNGQVTISWSPVSGATSYNIYWSATSGVTKTSGTKIASVTSPYVLKPLTNGKTYYFIVTAKTAYFEGTASGQVSATPSTTGWSAATRISNTRSYDTDIYLGDVDINGNGTAAAVWAEGSQIWSNRFENGMWGSPGSLSINSKAPWVAVAPDGDAIAIWEEDTLDESGFNVQTDIRVRHYSHASGVWGSTILINDSLSQPGSYAYDARVAIDGNGNAIAVWQQDAEIWANRYENGTGWTGVVQLSSSVRLVREPQVGVDGSGNFTVAWIMDTQAYDPGQTAGGPSDPKVFARRYSGGAWDTSEQQIAGNDIQDWDIMERLQMAVNNSGTVVLVWERRHTSMGYSIDTVRYDPDTLSWGPQQTIGSNSWYMSFPQVALDSAGNAVAVWEHSDVTDTTPDVIRGAIYNATSGQWGEPVQISGTSTNDAYDPFAGIDASGNIFVIWRGYEGYTGLIYERRSDVSGTGWGNIVSIGYGSSELKMDSNSNGKAVIITPKDDHSAIPWTIAVWSFVK